MQFRVPIVSVALIAALNACGERDPVANNLVAVNLTSPTTNTAPAPEGGPPSNGGGPAAPLPGPAAPIPAALHGRWGLTPGDCTSTRGDAKGLLTISAREMDFYESRAVPSPGVTAGSDSITGNFAFAGEGQSWTKFESFERRKDMLVRTESNPAASYTYAKC